MPRPAEPGTGRDRLVYRNASRARKSLALIFGFCVLFPVSFWVLHAPGYAEAAVIAVCALAAARLAIVVPQAGIEVDRRGVTVRTDLGGVQQVAWQDVTRFDAVRSSSQTGAVRCYVQVSRANGRPLQVYGTSVRARPGEVEHPAVVVQMVAALEDFRLRQQTAAT
jgi:hypothetical protein